MKSKIITASTKQSSKIVARTTTGVGGVGGIHKIADAEDVIIDQNTLQDGYVLVYNSTLKKWVAVPPPSTSHTIFKYYQINTAMKTWLIEHNLDTRKFVANLRDEDGNTIFTNVKIIDSNKFEVQLTSPTKGSVSVHFDISTEVNYIN